MVSEYRDFSDRCATNYLFFVVAISNILLTGLPHPPTLGFLTPSVDLWTLTWWYVICAVVIYPSYFGIFICSPQVTFVANVTRIPQNLLVVAIHWFFSIFTFVDQYVYSYMYMYVLEHYINLFISDIIYIGIDATKSQLCIDIYTLMADQLNGLHVRKLQFAFFFNFLSMIY